MIVKAVNLKARLHRIEKPLLFGYWGLWLLVYLCSRIFLEMYSDRGILAYWPWVALVGAPLSLYAALRTRSKTKGSWYSVIWYVALYLALCVFATGYIIVHGDILLSAAFDRQQHSEASITAVSKVFRKKLGFDHTHVRLMVNGQEISMDARPYTFFYLSEKTTVGIWWGRSMLGNDYVTVTDVPVGKKAEARWLHFKDMIYRNRIFLGIVLCLVIGVLIWIKFFPDTKLPKRKPLSPVKLIGLVLGMLFTLMVLFYAGIWLYVKFLK